MGILLFCFWVSQSWQSSAPLSSWFSKLTSPNLLFSVTPCSHNLSYTPLLFHLLPSFLFWFCSHNYLFILGHNIGLRYPLFLAPANLALVLLFQTSLVIVIFTLFHAPSSDGHPKSLFFLNAVTFVLLSVLSALGASQESHGGSHEGNAISLHTRILHTSA